MERCTAAALDNFSADPLQGSQSRITSVLPRLTRLKGLALDFLFPRWCVGCGREGSFLCSSCQHSLPRIGTPVCPRCGKPQADGQLCPGCVDWPAAIDGIRSAFRFGGTIRQAVHQLKYRNLRALAVPLAELLYDYDMASTGSDSHGSCTWPHGSFGRHWETSSCRLPDCSLSRPTFSSKGRTTRRRIGNT